jgi:hypothetical protein
MEYVCVCVCMHNETDVVDEDLIRAIMRLLKELPL